MDNPFHLNNEQLKASNIIEGPVLVIAGAGSGKTRVVTTRIVNLISQGVPASKILAVTFTNKAAEEMRDRINKLTNDRVLVSTFHSLGVKILRESIHHLGYQNDFTIYDEEDVLQVLRSCITDLQINSKKAEPKAFRYLISNAKNALQAPEDFKSLPTQDEIELAFPRVYLDYQMKMQQYNAVDFDDLLYLTVRLWKKHPDVLAFYQHLWQFVLVDEYQDTNQAQYEMTRLLVKKSRNLFVVGDPDQSIYSWRGANIKNILNFELDYPGATVIQLEQNYRSRSNILEAANALISYNDNRYEKKLWSDKGPGEKIQFQIVDSEKEEANFVTKQVIYHHKEHIPLKEMVVFYRTNAQSRVFEDYLLMNRIPYKIIGGISFYQRREIKDILAFLRMVQSGADAVAFNRTINIPKRGIGDTTLEKITRGASEEGLTILAYCEALASNIPLRSPLKITAKQKEAIKDYVQILLKLRHIKPDSSLYSLVIAAIENTGYLSHLKLDQETYDDRKKNLDALIAKAIEWEASHMDPTLESFLEELSLKSTLDEADLSQDYLKLMTIHNGKGLEFTVTFLAGMEDELFPHVNSRGNPQELEEERRLCYVGMTRAKEHLYLSSCRSRYLWGSLRTQSPSRFLKEIPREYLEKFQGNKNKKIEMSESDEEQNDEPELGAFQPGEMVYHHQFGIGEVKEAYQGSMGLTYKVFFMKDRSLKTLIAKLAALKALNP